MVFGFGWACNSVYSIYSSNTTSTNQDLKTFYIIGGKSEDASKLKPIVSSLFDSDPEEVSSPSDWIKENQIFVYNDKIIINLKDAEWAAFTDTNSMDPIIDSSANGIEVIPKSEKEINVGDIASYKSDYADGIIIHRVIQKGADKDGVYFIMKGDNLPNPDPGKIRFKQIQRVLVAVIY